MSYPLAVSVLFGMVLVVLIWAGSLFMDFNLARQLLLVIILPSFLYLILDYVELISAASDYD
jgi:hypothetical protein